MSVGLKRNVVTQSDKYTSRKRVRREHQSLVPHIVASLRTLGKVKLKEDKDNALIIKLHTAVDKITCVWPPTKKRSSEPCSVWLDSCLHQPRVFVLGHSTITANGMDRMLKSYHKNINVLLHLHQQDTQGLLLDWEPFTECQHILSLEHLTLNRVELWESSHRAELPGLNAISPAPNRRTIPLTTRVWNATLKQWGLFNRRHKHRYRKLYLSQDQSKSLGKMEGLFKVVFEWAQKQTHPLGDGGKTAQMLGIHRNMYGDHKKLTFDDNSTVIGFESSITSVPTTTSIMLMLRLNHLNGQILPKLYRRMVKFGAGKNAKIWVCMKKGLLYAWWDVKPSKAPIAKETKETTATFDFSGF
jgi:hypothetical protein